MSLSEQQTPLEHVIGLLSAQAEWVPFYCSKHGDVRTIVMAGSGETGECEACRQDKLAKEREEILAKERTEIVFNCGIEPRYKQASYKDFVCSTPDLKIAKGAVLDFGNNFAEYLKNGQGMVLTGKTGTGKTLLGSILTRHVITKGNTARYVALPDLIGELFASFDDSSKSELDIFEKYADYDLLVIDEISATKASSAEKTRLFALINKRYNRLKSTVVISNCSFEELGAYVDGRVISRLKQDCKGRVIGFNGKDWRVS